VQFERWAEVSAQARLFDPTHANRVPGGKHESSWRMRPRPTAAPGVASAAEEACRKRFSKGIAQGMRRSADLMQLAPLEELHQELDALLSRVQQVM
jgi:hypothetical protein